jgi:hypothetical protein
MFLSPARCRAHQTGGLVGYTTGGATIRYAFTLGSVRGANDVGGLVGYHYSDYPEIADCYSRASVSGAVDVGGLIGYMHYSRAYRSYSSGAVSGTSMPAGSWAAPPPLPRLPTATGTSEHRVGNRARAARGGPRSR